VAGLLRSGLSKKDDADAVLRSSYANVKKFLRGLDSLRFQIGCTRPAHHSFTSLQSVHDGLSVSQTQRCSPLYLLRVCFLCDITHTANIFQLKCNNLDIIAFLPTVVELGLSGSST
jgi:hypothetical protein